MEQQQLVSAVIEAVRAVLRDPKAVIHETTDLQDLQGFDSLAVVDIIERLERELDTELDPALILPETFATPLTIAEALINSRTSSGESANDTSM